MDFRFTSIDLPTLLPTLQRHASSLSSPFDAFLEDHILKSNHYHITHNGDVIGWTAIHQSSLITQFGLFPGYRYLGQEVFPQVRKLELVQNAFIPTSDEFFLSHALDNYRLLEKQAHFFQYDPARPAFEPPAAVTYRQATAADETLIRTHSGDFLDPIAERIGKGELSITLYDGECAGFGIIERSKLIPGVASIGMFTLETMRIKGIGASTLTFLIQELKRENIRPIAGCWYYNHLSKKTLEKAGMFTQTRLLKVSF